MQHIHKEEPAVRVSSWLYLTEQTACGACLLCAIGLCAGLKHPRPCRILLTAAILALFTMAAQMAPPLMRLIALAAPCAAPILAWPDAPRRMRLRLAMLSAGLSLLMAGMLRLMAGLALPGPLALALGCAGICAMPALLPRAGDAPPCTSVRLRIASRSVTLTALVDSGNLLRDLVTGLPVIVISRRSAARLLPPHAPGVLLPGMRLMTVRTISGSALMTILRPDEVSILAGQRWQRAEALLGLSPDGYEGFQALVPASLLHSAAPLPRKAISQGG